MMNDRATGRDIAFIKGAIIGAAIGAVAAELLGAALVSQRNGIAPGPLRGPAFGLWLFVSRAGPALGAIIGGFVVQRMWRPPGADADA